MIELDILNNTLAQFETLKADARTQQYAAKVAEQAPALAEEITNINADFEKAQAMLIEKRDKAIAEKKAAYNATAEAYAESAVIKINKLITDLKKIEAGLEG